MPSADGAEAIWFQDDTGDEEGRWVSAPFEGGGVEPLLGLEPGWPSGIALGLHTIVAGRSDHDGLRDPRLRRRRARSRAVPPQPARDGRRHRRRDLALGLQPGRTVGGRAARLHRARGTGRRGPAWRCACSTSRPGETVGDQWDGEGLGLNACAWSPVPGDQRLAISHERYDRTRPAIWDLATGERTDLEVDLPGDVVPMDWWPDASALLVAHVFEGRDELYRLEVATGALERIQHEAGTVHEARVRPDGDVWMQLSSGGRPPHAVSARTGRRGRAAAGPPARRRAVRVVALRQQGRPEHPRVRGEARRERTVPRDHARARRADLASTPTSGSPRCRPTSTTASPSGS